LLHCWGLPEVIVAATQDILICTACAWLPLGDASAQFLKHIEQNVGAKRRTNEKFVTCG
jgi:hypothetical protein